MTFIIGTLQGENNFNRGVTLPTGYCFLAWGLVAIFLPASPSHALREGLAYTTTCAFLAAFLYLVSTVNPTLVGTFLFRYGEESDPAYWLAQVINQLASFDHYHPPSFPLLQMA